MSIFLKVVAAATAIVALLALWARLPLRAALLLMIAAVVWNASKRTLQRPGVMIAAAIVALLVVAANLIGPWSLGLFGGGATRP